MTAMFKGPPKPKDPIRIPNAGDPDIKELAAQRQSEEAARRRGRRATDLSGGQPGIAYSRTTVG